MKDARELWTGSGKTHLPVDRAEEQRIDAEDWRRHSETRRGNSGPPPSQGNRRSRGIVPLPNRRLRA
ncbi:hypothetical protein [Arenibaculum pallidiluteum]|uniref:hypothetical protein n=1 Tax=Arenibaculum pallidiluteum TaxID=2812559 RepID=UPI001A965C03|nr:hypothetical protein [Arenibaculum pallidiluteum]